MYVTNKAHLSLIWFDEEIVIFVQTIHLIAIEDMQIDSETDSVSDWCFTEASAVTETGLISQETYFSDVCQIDWYFMHGISQKLLAAPFNASYFQMVFAYYMEFKRFTTV